MTLVYAYWPSFCFIDVEVFPEDAPAPKAIHSFQTKIQDGKIHVTANSVDTLKSNMSRQPTLLATGINSSGPGVVIVGGGAGAFQSVESLREVTNVAYFQLTEHSQTDDIYSTAMQVRSQSFRKRVTLLLIGKLLAIFPQSSFLRCCHRTRLSKGLPTDATKLEYRTAADLKIKYGTNVRLGVVRSRNKSS